MTKIFYDKEASIELAKNLNLLAERMNDATSGFLKRANGYIDNGLADELAKDTAKTSSNAENLAYSAGNALSKVITDTFDKEVSYASYIDKIVVPKDFLAENSTEVNHYNTILLSKVDGKSVNEGEKTDKVDNVKDSKVVRDELSNINKDETQQREYDSISSLDGQQNLENINKDETEAKTYDDSSRIKYTNFDNISGNTTEEKTYDDSSQLKFVEFENPNEIYEDKDNDTTKDTTNEIDIGK